MTRITYEIVPHDGGWAYRVNGAYSESFASREDAVGAAKAAAREQRLPDEPHEISWEDENGRWHTEMSDGDDRPDTEVSD